MRVTYDSPIPGGGWTVWDCRRCMVLHDVAWVDDALSAYWQLERPLRVENDQIVGHVVMVDKVQIMQDRMLILIDPIADEVPKPLIEAVAA